MFAKIKEKKITGVIGILPENEYLFEDEIADEGSKRALRLKKVMGYGKRRRCKKTTVVSDFCIFGLEHLLRNNYIQKDEIGAVIVITLTPDYFVPHVSNLIQGRCDLGKDVLCIDIPQGCAGYLLGLFQAFMVLEHMEDKKALVFCGDVLCRKMVDGEERFIAPPFGGDAMSITIVENDKAASPIYLSLYTDGQNSDALVIPGGAYKEPILPGTDMFRMNPDGIMQPITGMWMDGSKVFNFVQREVPPMLDELFQKSQIDKTAVDWFLFHQPNRFMLEKLAARCKIPMEKLPANIVETFGNTGGSTVPLNITYNVGKSLEEKEFLCCLSSFGSGLTWGAMLLKMGNLDFCQLIESNC